MNEEHENAFPSVGDVPAPKETAKPKAKAKAKAKKKDTLTLEDVIKVLKGEIIDYGSDMEHKVVPGKPGLSLVVKKAGVLCQLVEDLASGEGIEAAVFRAAPSLGPAGKGLGAQQKARLCDGNVAMLDRKYVAAAVRNAK